MSITQATLVGAQRVTPPHAEYAAAVELAVRDAQRFLILPPLTINWCTRVGGVHGETHHFHDGRRTEIWLNAAAKLSAGEVWSTTLHELKHAADGPQFCANYPIEAEDRAVKFPWFVREETSEWRSLSWRRPSLR